MNVMEKVSACQSCRSRRIKCDGGKPICQKCINSRLPCVQAEAARQSLFVIHSENRYASGKGHRPRGPRSKLISLRPEYDIETRARAYYLQHHFKPCQDAPELVESWPECYHIWQSNGGTSDIVDHSLSCLALAVFARSQQHPPAAQQASRLYQHLLGDMKKKLASSDNHLNLDNVDALIMSAYFMARYESIVQQDGDSTIPLESITVWSHFDGVAAILEMWYKSTQRSLSSVVRQARRTLLRISLLRQRQLPGWLHDGRQFGERDFALDLDTFLVRILDLKQACLDWKSDHETNHASSDTARRLSEKAHDLHQAMNRWKDELPRRWLYHQHVLPEDTLTDQFVYSRSISTCTKQGFAAVWLEYFATLMLLIDLRIQVASFMESSHDHNCSQQMVENSEILASFMPFCLERVRLSASAASPESDGRPSVEYRRGSFEPYLANLVVWPLSLASSLQELDDGMRSWFRSTMVVMNGVTSECLLAYTMNDSWTLL